MEPWWSRLGEALRRPGEVWPRHRENDELGLRLSELPALALFFQVWAVAAALAGLLALEEGDPVRGLGLLLLAAVLGLPATFREHVLLRCGLVRTAAVHAALDTWSWHRDRIGGSSPPWPSDTSGGPTISAWPRSSTVASPAAAG